MVVQRGLRQAASFHQDRLRQEKAGYFFDVITNGFGAMPDYAEQIPVRDRWLIVAYVRALQFSQHAPVDDVPAEQRAAIDAGTGSRAKAPRPDQRRNTSVDGNSRDLSVGRHAAAWHEAVRHDRRRARRGAGGRRFFMAGAAGADRFFQAYLVAYTFWMGVVLGSLALLMVQHLSGGVWGLVLRRPFEAAVRTLPFMALLFLPIIFGMHSLYEWIARGHHRDRPDHPREGALSEHAVLPRAPGRSTSWSGARSGIC